MFGVPGAAARHDEHENHEDDGHELRLPRAEPSFGDGARAHDRARAKDAAFTASVVDSFTAKGGLRRAQTAPLGGGNGHEGPSEDEIHHWKLLRRRSSIAVKMMHDAEELRRLNHRYNFGRPTPETAWQKFRLDACKLLNEPTSSLYARVVSLLLTVLILGSVLILVLNTVKGYTEDDVDWTVAEYLFSILFTLELALRVTCQYQEFFEVFADPYFYIDFLAVLPFYVEVLTFGQYELPDILKAVRIVRLFKLFRQFQGAITLSAALEQSFAALTVPLFFLAVSATTFGVFIYYIEEAAVKWEYAHDADGNRTDKASAFDSIPHAIWFVFVTMTTVGYGDVYPESALAKFVDIFAMIFGVLFLSMPLAILGNNFCSVWDDRDRVTLISRMREGLAYQGVNKKSVAKAFESIDLDGSGTVNFKEFVHAVNHLNVRLAKKNLQRLWRSIDRDGSGEIQVSEFTDLLFPELEEEEYLELEREEAQFEEPPLELTIDDLAKKLDAQEKRLANMESKLSDIIQLLGPANENGNDRKLMMSHTAHSIAR